jgi:hypothetical protein
MADHDQLICGFQQMKPALSDLVFKTVKTDLSIHPMPIAPDHTARCNRFCREDLGQPKTGI